MSSARTFPLHAALGQRALLYLISDGGDDHHGGGDVSSGRDPGGGRVRGDVHDAPYERVERDGRGDALASCCSG